MALTIPRDPKGPWAAIICYFAEACCEPGIETPVIVLMNGISMRAEPITPWGFVIVCWVWKAIILMKYCSDSHKGGGSLGHEDINSSPLQCRGLTVAWVHLPPQHPSLLLPSRRSLWSVTHGTKLPFLCYWSTSASPLWFVWIPWSSLPGSKIPECWNAILFYSFIFSCC